MNKRLRELRQRRAVLLAEISLQREQIAEFNERYHGQLVLADLCWAPVRVLYRNPLLAGVLTVILIARRRNLKSLARIAWKVWRGYRLFRGIAGKLMSMRDSAQGA
jgi:YqjK-like protein